MLGVTNTKYAFRQHLGQIGFLMDQPPKVVRQALYRHMGPQRYAHYEQIGRAALAGGDEGQNRVYDFMQDLREANLLRCMSPDVTLDTSYYLYEKALPVLAPGKRLIELACWTGGLSSFIAENHPDCTVVGVDRARRILELNRAHYRRPNLSFVLWDYRDDKPKELEPADILLCGLGTNHDCPPGTYTPHDPLTIRDTAGYQREKQEGCRYFGHWRQAARDGAVLFTVLRIVTFARFLAFTAVARQRVTDGPARLSCPRDEPPRLGRSQRCSATGRSPRARPVAATDGEAWGVGHRPRRRSRARRAGLGGLMPTALRLRLPLPYLAGL